MNIITWNVNGYRAILKKGFKEWVLTEKPDILMLQEIKMQKHQLVEEDVPEGYEAILMPAVKPGYSGVATFCRQKPLEIIYGINDEEVDHEGRVLTIRDEKGIIYVNTYFPNSQDGGKRLHYKLSFCQKLNKFLESLVQKYQPKFIFLAGDLNIAHKEIDLARPKENVESPGFLPEERSWMDTFVQSGWVDLLRSFHPEPQLYTWWSYRTFAREKNIGWRIDYILCRQENALTSIQDCEILSHVLGSDHCPVKLTLKR